MSAARGSREGSPSFDPEAVRAALAPLAFGGLSVAGGEEQRYFAFYGIDFANRIPGVVHHFGTLRSAGFEIACHFYEPPRARGTCVLVHGYFDHAGLYGKLIAHCLRAGQAVLAFDLPGHGLSSGEQASIESFAHYVDVLDDVLAHHGDRLPQPLYGIGQSTGGAILMASAFRHRRKGVDSPFARTALLAPLVRPAEWRKVRFAYTVLRPFRRAIARTFMENSGDAAFLAFVQADPLQSRVLPVRWVGAMRRWVADFLAEPPLGVEVLVVQGDADATVDWRWNVPRIRERFPAASVRIVPGARHHLVNETSELRETVFGSLGLV